MTNTCSMMSDMHRKNTRTYPESRTKGLSTQWKPGQSGNPSGRPPTKTFTEICNRILDERVDENDVNSITKREQLCRTIITQALAGHKVAIKELLARLDPAPQFNINVNNNVTMTNEELEARLMQLKNDTESLDRNKAGRLIDRDSKTGLLLEKKDGSLDEPDPGSLD